MSTSGASVERPMRLAASAIPLALLASACAAGPPAAPPAPPPPPAAPSPEASAAPAPPSLRFSVAANDAGIVLAGEVPEAVKSAPASLTVTVTTPRPELPKLGYMRDWLVMPLVDEADCEDVQGLSDMPDEQARSECRAWRVDQLDRRAKIEQRFTRRITVPLRASGRAFEGLLPRAELPLVAGSTLREIEVSVEPPLAWRAKVQLDRPLRVVPEGSLTDRLLGDPLQKADITVSVVEPAHPERIVYFFNEAGGFAVRPTTPSPDEMVVDLDKRRRVVDLPGGTAVDEIDSAAPPLFRREEGLLVTSVGDRVIEVHALGRHRVHGVLRRKPDTADLVVTYLGYYNTFGNGTCGMCPVAFINLQTVHAGGHVDEPWWGREIGGGPPMEYEPTDQETAPDGRKVTVIGNTYAVSEDPHGNSVSRDTGRREMTWTWSDAKGEYVESERKLPKLPPPRKKRRR